MLSQLRLYFKLKIKGHLIFSMAFLVGILNRIIYFVNDAEDVFYSVEVKITYYLSYLLLIFVMSEFRRPKVRNLPLFITLILFVGSMLAIMTPIFPRDYTGIFEEVFRVVVAGIVFVVVIDAEYLLDNWKVRIVRTTLLIIGFLLLVLALFRLYSFVLLIRHQQALPVGSFIVRDTILAMVAALASFLAIFFPDLFLITHSQLSSVFKLYNIVPENIAEAQSREYVIQYLKNLPNDLLRDLRANGEV